MSVFVFAGASQFVAADLMAAGAAYPFIVLTTLIVNLRHALYGASVAQYLRGLSEAWRVLLGFSMTDESFAIAITHYRKDGDVSHKHWYFLGANLVVYVAWQISTALGFFVGSALGDPLALGLDFTLPLVFIAILVPQLKTHAGIFSALVASLVAIVTFALPNKLGLLLAMASGISAGLMIEKWTSRS